MTDTFRQNYTELTIPQKEAVTKTKEMATELLAYLNSCVPMEERSDRSRCMAIARTNLETTIMWAVKALTTEHFVSPDGTVDNR